MASFIFTHLQDLQSEWGLVCDTIYSSFSRVIEERKEDIKIYVDDILVLTITNYKNAIAEKVAIPFLL